MGCLSNKMGFPTSTVYGLSMVKPNGGPRNDCVQAGMQDRDVEHEPGVINLKRPEGVHKRK